jgi:hypothetical protein
MDDDLTMLIGPARDGAPLEIGVLDLNGEDPIVIHAMRLRPKFYPLIGQGPSDGLAVGGDAGDGFPVLAGEPAAQVDFCRLNSFASQCGQQICDLRERPVPGGHVPLLGTDVERDAYLQSGPRRLAQPYANPAFVFPEMLHTEYAPATWLPDFSLPLGEFGP